MRSTTRLLLLCVGLLAAGRVEADEIASADLQIQGVGLRVITVSASTGLDIPAVIQTEFGGKQNEEAQVVEGLLAVGELSGPGIDAPIRLETAPGHKFQIPGLSREGVYFLQNIRLMKGDDFLQVATPAVATITVSNLLQTSVRVRQLSAEEIRARGISVDPRNFEVYEYTFSFLVNGQIVEIPFPVVIDPRTHEARPIVEETPYRLPPVTQVLPPRWHPPDISTFELFAGEELPEPSEEADRRSGTGRPSIPAALIIPNNLAVLHQFFAVTLMVTNGAPSGSNVTLDSVTGQIKPPASLRTVKSIPSVSFGQPVPIVDATTGVTFLVAEAKGEAEWTMEGLQPGTHTVEVEVRATYKSPGQADFPMKGSVRASVVVHDPRFNVTFSHPDTVRKDIDYSTYSFITNMSGATQNIVVTNGVPACAEAPGANVCRVDGTPASHPLEIPPGEMRSIEYKLKPGITGHVFATAGSVSDDNITASVQLHMGVSESGIPLSPATLVMPYYARYVGQPMVSANLQLLGLGYSLATAPLTPALAKHPHIIKTDVFQRATDIARAGQRVFLGEAMLDSLSHMSLDLLGNSRELAEWDELRRREKSGRAGAASVARELEAALGGGSTDSFASRFATVTAWREPYLFALSSRGDVSVRSIASNARMDVESEAAQGWIRQVPYGELTKFRDGELAIVGRFIGNYEVSVTPLTDGPFTLDLIIPAAEMGSVLHAQLSAVGTAGKKLTVAVTPGASTLELRDNLGGIAAQASTATVTPEALSIIGARQDLNLDPGGHKVSVLWNRPVAVAAGDDLLTKFAAEVVLNRDGIDFRGPRPMSAAALQEGGRVVNVTFDHALSRNAEYSMTVAALLDPLTSAPASFNNPISPVIDNDAPGGIIFGRVLKGDNTAIANAEVRLSLATIGAGPPQWDLSRSTDGAFLFEFIPRDVDNGLPGSYKLEATTTDGKTTSVEGAVRLPGRVHIVNLVFLGRGSAEGIVRYDNGQVVAEATVVVGSTMFNQFREGVTDSNGRYSVEDLPVGPLTFTATDKDGNITFAASEIRTAGQVVQQDLSIFRRPFPGSGTVHGVVRRSDTGAAVPFSEIGVYSQGYGLFDGFTDAAGRFSFRVPVGFITVLAAEWTLSRENAAIDFDLAANEVKEVTLTLNVKPAEPMVALSGTVRREDPLHPGDPAFYQPVAGALIKIDKAQAVTADADGKYVFPSIPVSFTDKKVQAYDPLTKKTVTYNVPQLKTEGDNVLPILIDTANGYGEGTIRVRLLNAAGFPVNGFRVFEPGFPPIGPKPLEAKPNGVYQMLNVPVGATITIWAVGDGASPYYDQTATGTAKVEFNGHVAALNLRLPGQGTVRTKLTADIDLIGDVKLTYPAWEEADMTLTPKSIVSNSSENGLPGFATFPNIPAGFDFTVESLHPVHGYASKTGKIGFDGDVQSLTLQLDRLSTVSGIVYAIDGRTPIAGARIRIEDGRQDQGVFFTQPDGSFRFFNIPANVSFRVIADITQDGTYRTGIASGRTAQNGGPVEGVTVVMRTQGSISGRVVYHGFKVFDPQNPANNVPDDTPNDFTDNAPVPLANFILRELDFPGRTFGTTADPESADGQGRFSFSNIFTGPLRITAFDPGNQEIRGAWTGAITTEGEQINAIVTIGDDGVGTISVRVLDPNAQNAPVLNAEVLLIRSNQHFDLGSTDITGRVRFEQVPATGTYRINAYSKTLGKSGASGNFTVAPNATVEQTIVLEFSGKVEGTLTDPEAAGAGVPGAPVTLNAASFLTRASTDSAGFFVFDGVREGLFTLEAKDTLTNRRATASRNLTQSNPHLIVPLELEPTETLYLNVYLPNDAGGSSGTLAPLVNIDVSQRNNDFKRSLQGNAFQMQGLLENERYSIRIRELGGASRELNVAENFPKGSSATPLNVVLPAYGSVETRVTQAGLPAANAKVTVTGGGKSFVVFTDEAGIGLAGNIPLGNVSVQVVSADKAFSGSSSVLLTSQSIPAIAQVSLGAFAGITGLVEAEAGGPSIGTRVVASFSRILEVFTDSTGRFTFQGIPTGSLVNLTYIGPNDVTVGGRQSKQILAEHASTIVPVDTVRLDGTPPQVASFFPADGANNVSPDSTIRILFTERIEPARINTQHFQLLPADSAQPVATTFSSVTNPDGTFEVRMTPPAAPPGQIFPLKSNYLYRIIVSAEIRDLTGNKMVTARGASFITSDYAEPKVLKVLPPVTAALLPATTFEFRFNEPIDPLPWQPNGNGQFHFYKISAPGPGGSIVAEKPGRAFVDPAAGLSLFFAPDDPIEQESFYRVVFSGVRDLQGNPLAQQTFHFFSYDLVKPFVTLVSPVPAGFPLISGVEYILGVDLRNGQGGSPATDIAKVDYFRVDNGVASYLFTATVSPWTYRFVGPDAPPAGSTLTLRAIATDLSTNESAPADFTWQVKPNAAPQNVTVTMTPSASIYPGNTAFAAVTFEDEGVLATVQIEAEAVHTDGTEFTASQVKSLTRTAVNSPWPAANFSFDLPGTLEQGTNATFTATVTDVRGLKGTGSNSLALSADAIAPEILSISPAAQTRYIIGQKFQITALVQDLETGAQEVVFAFDNQSIKVTRPSTKVVPGGQAGTWVFSSGEITVPAKNVDTTIPITVTAKDYSGNVVSRTTEVIYVGVNDPTVPKGAWVCPVEKAVYPAGAAVSMKLRARATDDIAITGVKFTVPGITDPITAARVGTTEFYEATATVTMPLAGESLTLLVTISDANAAHDITLPVLIDAVLVDEIIDDRIQAVTPQLAASYMNKSVLVRGAAGRFIPQVPLTLKNLIVLDGARVETLPSTTTVEQRLDLTIIDRLFVDCASFIDVSGKGYLGGRGVNHDGSGANTDPRGRTVGNTSEGGAATFAAASHAGIGGEIQTGVTNAVYGSITNPTDLGAGGGGGVSSGNAGGSGGGVVKVQAPLVVVAGTIAANGSDDLDDGNPGAGGSISITASQFITGPAARISANGGDDQGATNSSRGAGGGRIAINATDRFDVETPGVQVQARGGRNVTSSEARSFIDGGAGTVFVRRPGQTLGELFIGGLDERFEQSIHLNRATPLAGTLQFDRVTLGARALARADASIDIGGVIDDKTAATIDATAVLILNGEMPAITATTAPVPDSDLLQAGPLVVNYTATSAAGVGNVVLNFSPIATPRNDVYVNVPLSVTPPTPVTLTVPATTAPGPATLVLTATDRAGRSFTVPALNYSIVANAPPTLDSFVNVPESLYPGKNVVTTASASDDLKVTRLSFVRRIGTGNPTTTNFSPNTLTTTQNVTTPVPITTPGGQEMTVEVTVEDAFPGRTPLTQTKVVQILLDTVAPAVTIVTPVNDQLFNEGSGNTIAMKAAILDSEVGVKEAFVQIEGLAPVALTKSGNDYIATLPVPSVDGTEIANKSLTVTAKDYEGNTGTHAVNIRIQPNLDPNGPSINWVCSTTGAMYPAGYSAKLRVFAVGNSLGNPSNGVAKVEFFVGDATTPLTTTTPVSGLANHYEVAYPIPAEAVEGSVVSVRAVVTNVAGGSEGATTSFEIVSGMVITANTAITATTTTYDNQTVIVRSGTTTIGGQHAFANLIVLDGAIVTQEPTDATTVKRLTFTVTGDVFVSCTGSIDVSNRGITGMFQGTSFTYDRNTDKPTTNGGGSFFSAGSHGGRGGPWTGGAIPQTYGSYTNPNTPGSAGTGNLSESCAVCRSGGGVVRITADTIHLEGKILANGQAADAAGAGGSIRLDAATISGPGEIHADGGANGGGPSGGGGRVAVYYTNLLIPTTKITASALNPLNPSHQGGAGTVFLKSAAQQWGELIVDNGGRVPIFATSITLVNPGTVTAISGNVVTLSAPVPFDIEGTWIQFLNATGGVISSYPITARTATTVTVNLGTESVVNASIGSAYRGMLGGDRITARGAAVLDVSGTVATAFSTSTNGILRFTNVYALADMTLQNVTLDVNGTLTAPNLTVGPGAVVTHTRANATTVNRLNVDVANILSIDANGAIDVSGRGLTGTSNGTAYTYDRINGRPTLTGGATLQSGGSHGGQGGLFTTGVVAAPYGSVFDPNEPGGAGAGGAGSTCMPCRSGGGVARIKAQAIELAGKILANGQADGTSAGAGGSIRIDATSILGNGEIRADGAQLTTGASGGGGRIAVYHSGLQVPPTNISAAAGAGFQTRGGAAGTVYLKTPSAGFGDLIVDNLGRTTPRSTTLSGVGYATATSFTADSVTDSNAQFLAPDQLRGIFLVANYDRSIVWPILSNTNKVLTLDVSARPLAVQNGHLLRGLYLFDNLKLRNAKLETIDLLQLVNPMDADATSSVIGNNQLPPMLNAAAIALQPNATGAAVIGTAGAVADLDTPIALIATNTRTGNIYNSNANPDGTFAVPVQGAQGDVITLKARDANVFPLESATISVGALQAGTPVPTQVNKTAWTTEGAFVPRTLSTDGEYLAVASHPTGSSSATVAILSVVDAAHPNFIRTVTVQGAVRDVVVQDGWAYIASDRLSTLDLSNPASTINLPTGDVCGSDASVTVHGGYAFTTMADCFGDGEVLVYDVSAPVTPRFLGAQGVGLLSGFAFTDIHAVGNGHLVGISPIKTGNPAVGHDVMIIDRRNLSDLEKVVDLDIPDFDAFRGTMVGSTLYLVSQTSSKFAVVDLSDPLHPVVLAVTTIAGPGGGIAVIGNDAFAAAGTAGLSTLDVSNPAAPLVTGVTTVGGRAFDAAVIGAYVYVANELGIALVPAQVAPQITVSRIHMSLTGTTVVVTGVTKSVTGNMPIQVEVTNVATGAKIGGLTVQNDGSFSAMLPASPGDPMTIKATDSFGRVSGPLSIGTVPFGSQSRSFPITPAMTDGIFLARNVATAGNHLAVAGYPFNNTGGSDKIVLYDITDRNNPVYRRTLSSNAGAVRDMAIINGWLIFAADRVGTLDLSNPASTPIFGGDVCGADVSLEVVNGIAFTGMTACFGDGEINVWDVSTPSLPRYIRSQGFGFSGFSFNDVTSLGTDYLVGVSPVKTGNPAVGHDVVVIDRRDIHNMKKIADIDIQNFDAFRATAVGTTLYVASQQGDVAVVDLSDPTHPQPLGIVPTPGLARSFDAIGAILGVADGSAGATFVDISPAPPALPTVLGNQATGGTAWELAFNGATLYLVNEQGLAVIDSLGTPPLIDRSLITSSSNGATFATVTGTAKAILGLGPITIELRNGTSGATISGVTVGADGSFSVSITAASGDALLIKATDAAGRVSGPLSIGTVPFGSSITHATISTAMADASFMARSVAADGNHLVVSSYPNPTASDKLLLYDVSTPGHPIYKRTLPSANGGVREVEVVNGWAYIAGDRLVTLNLDDPAATPIQPIGDVCGADVGIVLSGGYAFTAMTACFGDGEINVWDVSTPSVPRYVRSQGFGYGGYAFTSLTALGNDYLIGISPLSSGGIERDVVIIDRRDIYNMKKVTDIEIKDFAPFRARVIGNTLLVSGTDGGVAIVDVSNPAAPVHLTTLSAAGAARGLELAGSIAAVANGSNGVSFVDMTTPTAPRVIGAQPVGGSAWDVALSRGVIYVATEVGLTSIVNAAVPPMLNERLIEITPSATATTVTGAANALTGVPPVSVQIINDATASSSPQSTVAANGSFSAATPALPGQHLTLTATDVAGRRTDRKLGQTFGPTTTRVANQTAAGDNLYRARRVASDGNVTFASHGSFHATNLGASARMMMFRQPNASEPPAVVVNVAGGVNDIEVSNGHLYIASDRLAAISLSDPTFTVRNPVGDVCGRDGAVTVAGSHAFTSMIDCFGDAEINIWDLANPAIPRFVRNVGTGISMTYRGLAALGSSYLIGFSTVRDISIIDRTNLNASPLPRVAELQIDEFDAIDGVVDGTMLYVAGYDGGVAIVDVTNPLAPLRLSVLRSIGTVRGVAVSGPNEIVAATGTGVTFINVTDKANPIVTGFQKLDGAVTDVYVVGNNVYAAGDTFVHTIVRP